jgi:hypothetical protein
MDDADGEDFSRADAVTDDVSDAPPAWWTGGSMVTVACLPFPSW